MVFRLANKNKSKIKNNFFFQIINFSKTSQYYSDIFTPTEELTLPQKG